MLPLCHILHITVNDLLSGVKVSEEDYQKKVEENMIALITENRENKKSMALSIISAGITLIAVSALICIASFISLPTFARILCIILAVITGIMGIGVSAILDIKAGYYECPHCHALFIPTMCEYLKGIHTLRKRMLTCHVCGKTDMCKRRIVK